jgi:arsenate reductase-like glutaredoxin family protein
MNYTKHTLQKIEELMGELQYTVRYEKGSFQSGYCLVENHKIAVVNRFFETEGRINTLIDILDKIEINVEALSEKGLKTYKEVRKKTVEKEAANEAEAVIENEKKQQEP